MEFPRAISSLLDRWDVVALIAVFAFLIVETMNYPESARQFPLVFLVGGLVCLLIELILGLLPERHADRISWLTGGMASDFVEPAAENTPSRSEFTGYVTTERGRLVAVTGLLLLFLLVAYVIGFLFTIPIYTFASIYLLGSADITEAVVLSVVLMVAVQVIFGDLMNVPVMEGMLTDRYELPSIELIP